MQKGRLLAFYNTSLCPRNATLPTYEKEALAITESLKRLCHYFVENKLVIKTDQQSLNSFILMHTTQTHDELVGV